MPLFFPDRFEVLYACYHLSNMALYKSLKLRIFPHFYKYFVINIPIFSHNKTKEHIILKSNEYINLLILALKLFSLPD